jgi:hypothetical protein
MTVARASDSLEPVDGAPSLGGCKAVAVYLVVLIQYALVSEFWESDQAVRQPKSQPTQHVRNELGFFLQVFSRSIPDAAGAI